MYRSFAIGYRLLLFAALLAGALFPLGAAATAAPPTDGVGIPEQTVLEPARDGAALSSDEGGYTSPERAATHPFTHMLLRVELTEPYDEHAHLNLAVRVSTDGQQWSAWEAIEENSDLWVPEDGEYVLWSAITYLGEGMRFWQVRARPAPDPHGHDAPPPTIARLDVNTVDARYGDEAKPTGSASLAGLSKPPVVSRTAWGCPDGQDSRVSPAYRYATHMVIHHTAGSSRLRSGETNWSDRVRAIWSFHTITRGWGDIGYNYIIDPSGVIYEGRAGGENAVGFHDTANYGSMGVSLIGTYESSVPPPAAQDSLVELLAWKANQNDINPQGESFYYGCSISKYCKAYTPNAVILNIAGHRQVTPVRTTCPGGALLNLLPNIRSRVIADLQGEDNNIIQPDNGDLVISELETSFERSDAYWYRAACGDGGHTFYTYATDSADESTNYGIWRATIPTTGRYRVYTHIPQGCALDTPPYATTSATYTIAAADGNHTHTVDHNTAEEWVDLGTYPFDAGNNASVTLNDLTGDAFSKRRVVFFDSVQWLPEGEAPAEEPGAVRLLDVQYEPSIVAAGELLQVTFTISNSTDTTIATQNPQSGALADGGFDPRNGYVYDEGECFLGRGDEHIDYADYPKEHDRFRVTLGPQGRDIACAGGDGGYPWRWGLNGPLAPGETRTITGYIRFRTLGRIKLQAGLIEEYVAYHERNVSPTTVTVIQEQQPPVASAFNTTLQPTAALYQVPGVPDNLLVRTRNPLSIVRGPLYKQFVWDGNRLESGKGALEHVVYPLVLEQTRVFEAPADGDYVFRTTSDGRSWLWVNGDEVVFNDELNNPPDMTAELTGSIKLDAGLHTLSFKYFQLADTVQVGYAVKQPGANTFTTLPTYTSVITRAPDGTFPAPPTLALAADDQGGSGIAEMRYSWGGTSWKEQTLQPDDPLLTVTPPGAGQHTLYYQALDEAGNASEIAEVRVTVVPPQESAPLFLPRVLR